MIYDKTTDGWSYISLRMGVAILVSVIELFAFCML